VMKIFFCPISHKMAIFLERRHIVLNSTCIIIQQTDITEIWVERFWTYWPQAKIAYKKELKFLEKKPVQFLTLGY
jgi:hypothetical protein